MVSAVMWRVVTACDVARWLADLRCDGVVVPVESDRDVLEELCVGESTRSGKGAAEESGLWVLKPSRAAWPPTVAISARAKRFMRSVLSEDERFVMDTALWN